jgi:polyribonucleotide nucleotidyltransferase
MEQSTLDLRVAGSADAIIMVEAGANEIDEAMMVDALELAHRSIQDLIRVQNDMREALGKPKRAYEPYAIPEALKARVTELMAEPVQQMVETTMLKGERLEAFNALQEQLHELLKEESDTEGWTFRQIDEALHDIFRNVVRRRILNEGIRPDGRDTRTIRPLAADVRLVPRPLGADCSRVGRPRYSSLTTLGMPARSRRWTISSLKRPSATSTTTTSRHTPQAK